MRSVKPDGGHKGLGRCNGLLKEFDGTVNDDRFRRALDIFLNLFAVKPENSAMFRNPRRMTVWSCVVQAPGIPGSFCTLTV